MTEASSLAMADVSGKPVTYRRAIAVGRIVLGPSAYQAVAARRLPKGDALALAEFAGIQGAKATPTLIPLCHPISLNRVAVAHRLLPELHAVELACCAEIAERTGVEMEALCGLQVALSTIWDLAKPLEPALRIEDVRLHYKEGGKSGRWTHPDGVSPLVDRFLEDAR